MPFKSNFSLFDPSPQHRALRQLVADFAEKKLEPQALQFDREERFNLELFKQLGPMGLHGLLVEEGLGGSGMDFSAMVLVHEELSRVDPAFCLAYLAHSVLCVYNIYRNGSEEQKKHLLPPLCRGEWVGALAMSEPDGGTDVLAMQTRAEKRAGKYLLSGRKMWITNGFLDRKGDRICDICFVYAKTQDKLAGFIVERGTEGFAVGQKIKDKLGMRASNTAELIFENCELNENQRIGKGDALPFMMKNLEVERLALGAMSLGIASRSLEVMNHYASERKAFKQSIRSFGQIQRHIADSYAEYQAVRSYGYDIARRMKEQPSRNFRLDCDSFKLLASQVGKRVSDRAIQTLGGYGYVGEFVVERLWRDAKLLEIGGGTNEALQKNITKDLSPQTCGAVG